MDESLVRDWFLEALAELQRNVSGNGFHISSLGRALIIGLGATSLHT